MATHEMRDAAILCARELTLDRQAGSIPGILARRAHIGLVAIRDDRVLGCCIGSAGQDAAVGDEGFIDLLVVDRAEQRRGLGRLALRGSESGVQVAVQGSRYVGFCAYGVNRLHEVGPVGTSPDLRDLGIGEVLLKRCLAEQRNRGVTSAELVWAGPLSYFSRTPNATIGRAFRQYGKDLAVADPEPDWHDRIGLI